MSEKTITAQAVPMPNSGYYFPFGESVTMENGQTMRMAWTITNENIVGEFVVMDVEAQIDGGELPDSDALPIEIADEHGTLLEIKTHGRDGKLSIYIGDEYIAHGVYLETAQEEQLLAILLRRKAAREAAA